MWLPVILLIMAVLISMRHSLNDHPTPQKIKAQNGGRVGGIGFSYTHSIHSIESTPFYTRAEFTWAHLREGTRVSLSSKENKKNSDSYCG